MELNLIENKSIKLFVWVTDIRKGAKDDGENLLIAKTD
jgi:hypothetical protein